MIRVLAAATFVVILNETIMINAIPLLSFIAWMTISVPSSS